ncbi:MAG: hypothetical protein Q7R76_04380 [Candidatus Woesearchaeota archaeon]|nr:hypothetical protein [Candidatus Woesearchaeota archaeon]
MKRVKAKDVQPGDRVIIKKSLYTVTGKKIMNGKVVLTANTVGRTAPQTDTSHYSPNTYISVP